MFLQRSGTTLLEHRPRLFIGQTDELSLTIVSVGALLLNAGAEGGGNLKQSRPVGIECVGKLATNCSGSSSGDATGVHCERDRTMLGVRGDGEVAGGRVVGSIDEGAVLVGFVGGLLVHVGLVGGDDDQKRAGEIARLIGTLQHEDLGHIRAGFKAWGDERDLGPGGAQAGSTSQRGRPATDDRAAPVGDFEHDGKISHGNGILAGLRHAGWRGRAMACVCCDRTERDKMRG